MSDFHTLQLSVRLNKLEEKIKNAKLVKFEKLPTEQCLATRKIIEYAKPTQVLGELVEEIPNQTNTDSDSENFDQEIVETESKKNPEQFKESFREVLRLAKSGQQSWWTDKLKDSTNAHIECLDEYYRQNYCDENPD